MEQLVTSVNVDSELVVKAVAKAEKEKVAKDLKNLINYLIIQFARGKFKVDFSQPFGDWIANKKTTIKISREDLKESRFIFMNQGIRPTNEYLVNFLLTKYLSK